MFTGAWAMAPVVALLNNVFEVRFDCFKILFVRGCLAPACHCGRRATRDMVRCVCGAQTHRRPVPCEDRDIGEWLNVIPLLVRLSLPIVAGLIVIGSGQLEFWSFGLCQRAYVQRDGLPHRMADVLRGGWRMRRFYDLGAEVMDPDFTCYSSWGYRLLAAVVIERLGVLVSEAVRAAYRCAVSGG